MEKSLSFIIPVYNSEKTVQQVVYEIENTVCDLENIKSFEIILVDDYSQDNTLGLCRRLYEEKPFIKLLSFSKNFGQHNAILAGLREATGDYMVILDDDLQTPPKEVSKLINKLENGYDVVFAKYTSKKYSWIRKAGSKLDATMANVLINKPKGIDINSFAIMRSFVVKEIINYDNPYTYLPGLVFRTTSNIGNVLVDHNERQFGKSNYNLKKLFKLWLNGFTNYSVRPLRISSFIGFLFSIIAFFSMVVLVMKRMFEPNVQMGWTSVMVLVMFFGGIQLISLGLLGEYVGRIFLSLNKTPQYVVKEYYAGSRDFKS